MALFNKTKVVFWAKAHSVDIYFDQNSNNVFNFDINLWTKHSETELDSLVTFVKQKKITDVTILVPDDIVLTKSFIYDSLIDTIDQKEVIGLAESFVPFAIDPEHISYSLAQANKKTVIRAQIFDKSKLDILKANLAILKINSTETIAVSTAINNVIVSFYKEQYFLLYPIAHNEYTLYLSNGKYVYLATNLKGPSLDIQKIINYSTLYFEQATNKIFIPSEAQFEIIATAQLDKTPFVDAQIATELKKASNLPLPVIGALSAIINSRVTNSVSKPIKKMENKKKNLLPIIAVFVVTASLVSIVIWWVMNKNKTAVDMESPKGTETQQLEPTVAPTIAPVIKELSKTLKLQVLNATEINGQAAIVKEMLTKLGFTSVEVGNAKENITENTVAFKKSVEGVKEYFESKLDSQFPATYTADNKETSKYDVVFTIGTDLKTGSAAAITTAAPTKAASATATPTKKPTATTSATPTTEP